MLIFSYLPTSQQSNKATSVLCPFLCSITEKLTEWKLLELGRFYFFCLHQSTPTRARDIHYQNFLRTNRQKRKDLMNGNFLVLWFGLNQVFTEC